MPHLPHPRVVMLLAALAIVVTGCARAPAAAPGEATVVEVVDGDTIVVDLGSATETVRLLGIDTSTLRQQYVC